MRLMGITSLLFLLSQSTQANEAPDPSKVYIKKITWAGSGCADSTAVGSNISADAQAFTLTFNSFSAEIGPGIPLGDRRSKCKIKVDLRIPGGWSYALFDVDYRGEVALEEGVNATFNSQYYFQSRSSDRVIFESHLQGEIFDFFQRRDTVGISDVVWSPCGKNRALNIESEVSLDTDHSDRSGAFYIDSMDGSFTQVYSIQWLKC
ncbi:DUF4360 domain-containing protein [Pseudobacteriovorax antillogorgiicola]|uniref:DUF4360 domain-containing protein n=1 Tax=Pseudobacteriovorax antillogorgiicola TaxID=1513793 RepID=A0A1Y6BUD2_9BACT|nr:DUF4360 domain-containing protein [Pseudobacteriovorax antillogorgiicola]TCS52380.1 uncharacterized protein DUF4360 [Pseudobacteriovorax antillogorgiicola]SMF29255.1 protein of unknown function [Pseudobacteriovorax antillogorgiicola]